jgi:Fe2+ transport system protein FeoA
MAIVSKEERKRVKERFDSEKIERSLHNMGIDDHIARYIAWKVPERDGITTQEIRKIVFRELFEIDPGLAEMYLATRRLLITTDVEVPQGIAFMKKETMARMRMVPGESIDIVHQGERHRFTVHHAPLRRNQIALNIDDLKGIGVRDGKRITVQRTGYS